MQAYLSIAVRESGRSAVIHVEGELDLASSVDLEDVISRARSRFDETVIDLAKLRFIDMAGLRVLITAHDLARQDGKRLVLTNVRGPVRRVLALAQVDSLLPLLEGEDAS